MKYIIHLGLILISLASSCVSITKQSMKSDTITEKHSNHVSESSMPGTYIVNASFPGGEEAMKNFIYSSLQYPKTDSLAGKQGVVIVQFNISSTGELSDFEIIRSLTPDCDAEALRVVKSMPKWIPATKYGTPINIGQAILIRFKIQTQE